MSISQPELYSFVTKDESKIHNQNWAKILGYS